ncbi:WxL domain surface cell wall-binding [Pilibacter termitis]|uniref:WxL domain surface cell wall-binding n=1 Tax=Pilibacter termitis TaxID=263852 RepID=A0A1T4MWX4_9ENTE|nr:WxL domain-containing protein [Pilibacter termitis]SJZ71148.1 WxL domain surface cell wall-binding [Pilibacter termitis]
MKKKLLATALVASALVLPNVASAAPVASGANGQAVNTGQGVVTFVGVTAQNGGLILEEVPSFTYATAQQLGQNLNNGFYEYKNTQSDQNAGAPVTIKVTDLRGGSTGYKVFAKAEELKEVLPTGSTATPNILPWATLKVTTTGSAEVPAVTDVDIMNKHAIVAQGSANSNGTHDAGDVTSELTVNQAGVKASTYKGNIIYTLADSSLVTP